MASFFRFHRRSPITSCSGPPYCCMMMARIEFSSRGADSQSELPVEEVANGGCNFPMMGFKREVAGIVKMDLRVRVIPPERFGAGGQEERVVLAPDGQ